ncbi:MAG: class I SAM-dependent methyltransferase [Candidatus Bathyarchaeota archaeon]|nr:class I SAM-dependent methyltransferase [Candidatus Bathyarchaeota archaeon]
MADDEVQRFYEHEARVYEELRFESYQGMYSDHIQKSIVLELVGGCKDKSILEIGSGTGRLTKELVKYGANIVCVDFSRKMHEHSRILLHGKPVEYSVMDGTDLGFADGTFDGCLVVNVMSHIRNDSEILMEVSRVLRKGGFFVANFPNMLGIYFPVGGMVNLLGRSLQAPVYSRWYSLKEIIRSLKDVRLNPVQVMGRMIFPRKYCPKVLFRCLIELDRRMLHSSFRFLSGELFVKSFRF